MFQKEKYLTIEGILQDFSLNFDMSEDKEDKKEYYSLIFGGRGYSLDPIGRIDTLTEFPASIEISFFDPKKDKEKRSGYIRINNAIEIKDGDPEETDNKEYYVSIWEDISKLPYYKELILSSKIASIYSSGYIDGDNGIIKSYSIRTTPKQTNIFGEDEEEKEPSVNQDILENLKQIKKIFKFIAGILIVLPLK